MKQEKYVYDGGIVNCIEGTRIWARTEDGREVLILLEEEPSANRS